MNKECRKFSLILVLALSVLLLEGCWDLKDIDQKLIVTAICYDVKDEEIWFYLEIANTEIGSNESQKSVEGSKNKFITISSHGKTLAEVRDNLDEKTDKPLYLSGTRIIAFTERFANKYLVEYLYRFRADETFRKQSITVITRDEPEELLHKTHENTESVGLYIEGEFKTLDESGEFFPRTTGRIIENLSGDYSGFLLPCIGIEDNLPAIIGYSVVKGAQVVGFIPINDSKIHGIYFLKVDKPVIIYIVPYKDINFTVTVTDIKRRIKPGDTDNAVSMLLSFDVAAELMYGNKKTPYNLTADDMAQMSFVLGDFIKKDITDAITQAQQDFNCDYLQFDDKFRIRYPDVFESMDWNEEFPKLSTTVDVKVDMQTKPGLDYGPNALQ